MIKASPDGVICCTPIPAAKDRGDVARSEAPEVDGPFEGRDECVFTVRAEQHRQLGEIGRECGHTSGRCTFDEGLGDRTEGTEGLLRFGPWANCPSALWSRAAIVLVGDRGLSGSDDRVGGDHLAEVDDRDRSCRRSRAGPDVRRDGSGRSISPNRTGRSESASTLRVTRFARLGRSDGSGRSRLCSVTSRSAGIAQISECLVVFTSSHHGDTRAMFAAARSPACTSPTAMRSDFA